MNKTEKLLVVTFIGALVALVAVTLLSKFAESLAGYDGRKLIERLALDEWAGLRAALLLIVLVPVVGAFRPGGRSLLAGFVATVGLSALQDWTHMVGGSTGGNLCVAVGIGFAVAASFREWRQFVAALVAGVVGAMAVGASEGVVGGFSGAVAVFEVGVLVLGPIMIVGLVALNLAETYAADAPSSPG